MLKKIVIILISITFFNFNVLASEKINVYIFTKQDDLASKNVIEYLINLNDNNNFNIIEYQIFSKDNEVDKVYLDLLKKITKKDNIKLQDIPITIIGSKFYEGMLTDNLNILESLDIAKNNRIDLVKENLNNNMLMTKEYIIIIFIILFIVVYYRNKV